MQLEVLGLTRNQLVGSLPETWSNLTNVGPYHSIDLRMVTMLYLLNPMTDTPPGAGVAQLVSGCWHCMHCSNT